MAERRGRFLKTLAGEACSPPPVWFMRQAGRYLPEYREVRVRAGDFLSLCYAPDLAAEVTLQPIRRFDLDAAILFADILLVPQALGQGVRFEQGEGPRLEPAFDEVLLARLSLSAIHDTLGPVYETVRRVRAALPEEKALIGFAGAPWTVATYMLAGRGVKDPSALRAYAYRQPEAFDRLIGMLTEATTAYLLEQVRAGADALQLFDSWAGGLPEPFFRRYCLEPCVAIAEAVRREADVPVIAFPRGAGPAYEEVARRDCFAGVSIDTGLPARWVRERLSPHSAVQGGLDPLLVVAGGKPMLDAADALLEAFAGAPYVFNLGHGFVPETPPEHVAALVEHVRRVPKA
jgi:uroporphyrinogen decarboxylase